VRTLLYAFACLVLPALWGLVMVRVFGYWERRRLPARTRDDPDLPPIDYSI